MKTIVASIRALNSTNSYADVTLSVTTPEVAKVLFNVPGARTVEKAMEDLERK